MQQNFIMSTFFMKKQYLAIVMLFFIVLLIFNTRPVSIQCQLSPEVANLNGYPTIYAITPTHARLTQKADLTRLSQTLMLVKDLHWIVVEDAKTKTDLVTQLLTESNVKHQHLNVKTHRTKGKNSARGVEQRNMALDWLREHLRNAEDKRGVVYFMDDDNTYSLKVFEEMRKIKHVGIWPVGLVGGMRVEMPLVNDGKVTGFNAVWQPQRPFPIDMAGFAINATLFLKFPEAKFTRNVKPGYQESEILRHVTDRAGLEPLAENCTKVYVWHTRTEKPNILVPKRTGATIPTFDNIELPSNLKLHGIREKANSYRDKITRTFNKFAKKAYCVITKYLIDL